MKGNEGNDSGDKYSLRGRVYDRIRKDILDGVYKESADANKDGVVDKLDYLAVLRDYYGYSKIEQ